MGKNNPFHRLEPRNHGTFDYDRYFPEARNAEGYVPAPQSFDALADRWLATLNVKHSTRVSYEASLKRYWRPRFGETIIDEIRHSEIKEVLAPLNAKTKNNTLIPMRGVLQMAVMDWLLDDDPTAKIKNAKVQKEPPDPLTLDKVETILADMREHKLDQGANYFETAFFTGMRPSEQIAVEWSDYARKDGLVRIHRTRVCGVTTSRAQRRTRRATSKCSSELVRRSSGNARSRCWPTVQSFGKIAMHPEISLSRREILRFILIEPSEGKLDLEVNFYERGLFPPAAYHSEGHQDGMGVCLYLALMKRLFSERFTFALLDDVVMSVDADHRYQFCKLLKTRFPNTQFVITAPALRHHFEYVSRLLADQLGAAIPFRNDGNYELGELLPSVLKRIKDLYGKAADAAQSWGNAAAREAATKRKTMLSTSNGTVNVEQWAVNKAVHYNEWANFGKKDFEPVVAAFKALLECFRCEACDSWLYVTPRTSPESLRCACNAISLNLKPKQ